ncbi:phospholipase A2 inhibitor and Ly6/PLAUR domain-containing protein-like [Carassius auratus]|uniref:Phospholipase A2 inhibitor and Ly6/PLAUR domain-containing protein-like n=1 Tax=Carassius auratus TaxID=7957 RepID=A0A6P6M316_CARAU|nr:phospholipase A2 inhibitor and Ly6/PLAUR domain-containing protein-like [Carassius auratus]XP_026091049.1 phospholipase A2 inhibitor and Ly6/PLAUR domain-containing protein-like [Carassius auratus]
MGSCADKKEITCEGESSKCMSLTAVTPIGSTSHTLKVKGCALPNNCQTMSYNFGSAKMSSFCFDTDLCNDQDSSDSISNGMKCYSCDEKSCSNTVSCSGSEDRCITATGSFGGPSVGVKGCVSKAICNATTSVPNVQSISCCSGNLFNSAQSVTQSFLFLCCSLLSFILLH